jgi:hypothetical protein
MAPAVLLCLGIVILLITVDATTIQFMMLVVIPCAVLWWLAGWKAAVGCAAAYFIFRAVRQRRSSLPPGHIRGMSRSKPQRIEARLASTKEGVRASRNVSSTPLARRRA